LGGDHPTQKIRITCKLSQIAVGVSRDLLLNTLQSLLPRMRIILASLLLSYIRGALGVPFVRDAIRAAVSATTRKKKMEVPEPGSAEFWFHMVISIFLVLAGGVFAG